MLKQVILSASILLTSVAAVAEPVVVPGEAFGIPPVAAALEQKCQPDCIVMNREDWAALIEKLKKAALEEAKNKNI